MVFHISHPLQMVVVQPSSLCNLNCRYCYVPERKNALKMECRLLERFYYVLSNTCAIDSQCVLVWHSGEPLAIKKDFYEQALQYQNKYSLNSKLLNYFQTNGTLINEEWCKFFIDNKIDVSVSVDGPAFIHDQARVDWGNKGTHKRVMRGIEHLKNYRIPYRALAVLVEEALDYPEEFFFFFLENGFLEIGINVEEIIGLNEKTSFSDKKLINRYIKFMKVIYSLWKQHKVAMKIREFDDLTAFLMKKKCDPSLIMRQAESEKNSILSVRRDGSITPFSPELVVGTKCDPDAFVVSHLDEIDSFDELFENKKLIAIHDEIKIGIDNCKSTCPYFEFCGGGSPSSKIYETGSFQSTETKFCNLYKKQLIDIALS